MYRYYSSQSITTIIIKINLYNTAFNITCMAT